MTLARAHNRNTVPLRSNDAEGNENVNKKTIGLISKTTTLHLLHTFSVHFFNALAPDYEVKMPRPYLAFYGGRKQETTKFYFSF